MFLLNLLINSSYELKLPFLFIDLITFYFYYVIILKIMKMKIMIHNKNIKIFEYILFKIIYNKILIN